MIKYKKKIILELERYPKICKECPMFHLTQYECCNERGNEGHCDFGYMKGHDMREFKGESLFKDCSIQNNPDVTIM